MACLLMFSRLSSDQSILSLRPDEIRAQEERTNDETYIKASTEPARDASPNWGSGSDSGRGFERRAVNEVPGATKTRLGRKRTSAFLCRETATYRRALFCRREALPFR